MSDGKPDGIDFDVEKHGEIEVRVKDGDGNIRRVFTDGISGEGTYTLVFTPSDGRGQ